VKGAEKIEMKNRNIKSQLAVAVIFLMSALFVVGAAKPEAPDPAYVQSFEKWKADQTADLKENWLSLAGLFWLKPGANSFGSDPSSQIVFPKGPAHAGEFELNGKDVSLKLQPEARAVIDGKAVTTAKLAPDTSEHVTHVEMGTLQFHVIVRGERVGVRVRDTDSVAARNFKGMVFFPLDMNYRVTATWVPADGKKMVEIPNVLGDVTAQPVPGVVTFKVNGEEQRLTALGGDAKTGLFFVFNDLTAKSDTYPGGRFLDTGPIVDGHVVLDFNRAYNPPCAVTPYATCPLAPKENRLAVAIPAGEKFDKAARAQH
jgi:uncharacterized protein (DUF1684 family)